MSINYRIVRLDRVHTSNRTHLFDILIITMVRDMMCCKPDNRTSTVVIPSGS